SGRRAALLAGPGLEAWNAGREPQGKGDNPLGIGPACGASRGAPLRPSVREGEPGRGGGRTDLSGGPEPQFAGRIERVQAGTEPGECDGWQSLSVRAQRLLLRGHGGQRARLARFQSHGDPARHLGEDRAEAEEVSRRQAWSFLGGRSFRGRLLSRWRKLW